MPLIIHLFAIPKSVCYKVFVSCLARIWLNCCRCTVYFPTKTNYYIVYVMCTLIFLSLISLQKCPPSPSLLCSSFTNGHVHLFSNMAYLTQCSFYEIKRNHQSGFEIHTFKRCSQNKCCRQHRRGQVSGHHDTVVKTRNTKTQYNEIL